MVTAALAEAAAALLTPTEYYRRLAKAARFVSYAVGGPIHSFEAVERGDDIASVSLVFFPCLYLVSS